MTDRSITFEKIFNARDLGGLRTKNGCVISSGLLIRSANLSDATEADRQLLREKYRLAKIIDLRTDLERNEKPDVSVADADYLPIPVFDISTVGISHEMRNNYEQILAVIPKMGQLYGKMVSEPSCRENLGKAARCVMEHDFSKGSVLWHCTEGKDRCGLLSAVLLLALGAERSTITEDYLLTNRVNAPKAEKYSQMLLQAGKTETEAEIVSDIFLAKEEYLNAAFSAIDAQYGNTDAFLRDGLNISQKLIEKFRRSVLKK
ncbi:MAG: tyrosine-protein phosphatase [Acutalibacteraceae bacterium]